MTKYSAEQTKRQSVIEASINVFTGMVIGFTISQLAHWFEPQIQKYIWEGFEWHISAASNVIMTAILTVLSVIRGYVWRRYFNNRHIKEVLEEKEGVHGLLQQYKKVTKGSLFKFEEKL